MSVPAQPPLFWMSDDGYDIDYSLRLRAANSAYLTRTPGAAATDSTKWTVSMWVKRGFIGADSVYYTLINAEPGAWTHLAFFNDALSFQVNDGGAARALVTTRLFRDPSAWYHIVAVWDRGNATAAQKMRLYINGVEETAFTTDQRASITGSANPGWNVSGTVNTISKYPGGASRYFDGAIANIINVDGQALTPSSFGETSATTGQWIPKAYTGTYGTNGFFLNFANAATTTTIGEDAAGSNDWTTSGISVTAGVTFDQLTDTPTNNYATLNPLQQNSTGVTLSAANMNVARNAVSNGQVWSTIGMTTGKWRMQVTVADEANFRTGISRGDMPGADVYIGNNTTSWGYQNGGTKITNSSATAYGNTWTVGDVLDVLFDADNGKLYWAKNGTVQNSGDPDAGTGFAFDSLTNGPYFFSVSCENIATANSVNFGQQPWANTISNATLFKALNTANLPTPAIIDPSDYVDVVLRTGTGASASVSSLAFQPDLVWTKGYSTTTNHNWFDAQRGVQVGTVPHNGTVEYTDANTLTAFSANGYTYGSDASARGVNVNTVSYADYPFKEGVTPGFDIVLDTGTGAASKTVSHSLGVVPHFMARFQRNNSGVGFTGKLVYHRFMNATPQNGFLEIGAVGAYSATATTWNDTAPTSSLFSVGSNLNQNTVNYATYLWTSVPGFSLCGSYVGNSSADGRFVWCGFKPAFIIIKNATTGGSDWCSYDDKRLGYNVDNNLQRILGVAQQTDDDVDIVSNGFKLRRSSTNFNSTGDTFVFVAFARSPFNYATAR